MTLAAEIRKLPVFDVEQKSQMQKGVWFTSVLGGGRSIQLSYRGKITHICYPFSAKMSSAGICLPRNQNAIVFLKRK